jgi:hypothetical protein
MCVEGISAFGFNLHTNLVMVQATFKALQVDAQHAMGLIPQAYIHSGFMSVE